MTGQTPAASRPLDARGQLRPALVRAATSVAILGLLLWWLPLRELVAAMQRIPAGLWAAVVAAFLAGHAVSALKWRMLLRATGISPSALVILSAHATGLFANLCLPSLVGGDLVRGGLVFRQHGRPEAVTLAGLADRLNDSFALVLLAGGGALACGGLASGRPVRLLLAVALLLLAVLAAGLLLDRVVPMARLPESVARVLGRLREARAALLARPGTAARAFALSLAIQAAFAALNWRLAVAIEIEQPAAVWFLVWPLAKLAALLPIGLGGIGVREVATAGLLAPFGVGATAAVAQSLCWEIVLVAAGLAAGALAMLGGGGGAWRSRELR